jgi:hypothetical protein
MPVEPVGGALPAEDRRSRLNWATITMFAVALAYVDGFWVTSFQGAIGSFERAEPPFSRWVRDSTMMLPLYFVAVVAAVVLARRLVGSHRRTLVGVAAAGLLVVAITSALAVAEVAASSAWDYRLQTRALEAVHAGHDDQAAAPHHGSPDDGNATSCTAVCAARRAAFDVHVEAVSLAGVLLVTSNLVLVAWILALRGDRPWNRPTGRVREPADAATAWLAGAGFPPTGPRGRQTITVTRSDTSSPTPRPGCGR